MFMIGFETERSISIDKDVEEVYSMVADFNTWGKWSPWICQEPDCPVVIKGPPGEVGHYQEWNGKRIGAGNMKIIEAVHNSLLRYDLAFLKPWKSTAKVTFEIMKKEIGYAPGHKAIKVVHTGHYKHLGNGWSAAMGARMALKRRLNKAIPMYEIYENDPNEVHGKDLITSIYVPVK